MYLVVNRLLSLRPATLAVGAELPLAVSELAALQQLAFAASSAETFRMTRRGRGQIRAKLTRSPHRFLARLAHAV